MIYPRYTAMALESMGHDPSGYSVSSVPGGEAITEWYLEEAQPTPEDVAAHQAGSAFGAFVLAFKRAEFGRAYDAEQSSHYAPSVLLRLAMVQGPNPYKAAVDAHLAAISNAQTSAVAAVSAMVATDPIAAIAIQPVWPTDPAPQPEDYA